MITLICIIGLLSITFLLVRRIRPTPVGGIPHFPITSFWGDIPRMASDTAKYGNPFDGNGLICEGVRSLGPVFQVSRGIRVAMSHFRLKPRTTVFPWTVL